MCFLFPLWHYCQNLVSIQIIFQDTFDFADLLFYLLGVILPFVIFIPVFEKEITAYAVASEKYKLLFYSIIAILVYLVLAFAADLKESMLSNLILKYFGAAVAGH